MCSKDTLLQLCRTEKDVLFIEFIDPITTVNDYVLQNIKKS